MIKIKVVFEDEANARHFVTAMRDIGMRQNELARAYQRKRSWRPSEKAIAIARATSTRDLCYAIAEQVRGQLP